MSKRVEDVVNLIVRDVAELPDRTSPDDQPEMMLVAANELRGILSHRIRFLYDKWQNWRTRCGEAENAEDQLRQRVAELESENRMLHQELTAARLLVPEVFDEIRDRIENDEIID